MSACRIPNCRMIPADGEHHVYDAGCGVDGETVYGQLNPNEPKPFEVGQVVYDILESCSNDERTLGAVYRAVPLRVTVAEVEQQGPTNYTYRVFAGDGQRYWRHSSFLTASAIGDFKAVEPLEPKQAVEIVPGKRYLFVLEMAGHYEVAAYEHMSAYLKEYFQSRNMDVAAIILDGKTKSKLYELNPAAGC